MRRPILLLNSMKLEKLEFCVSFSILFVGLDDAERKYCLNLAIEICKLSHGEVK